MSCLFATPINHRMCRCHFNTSPHLPLLLMMLFAPTLRVYLSNGARMRGKRGALKVKPEIVPYHIHFKEQTNHAEFFVEQFQVAPFILIQNYYICCYGLCMWTHTNGGVFGGFFCFCFFFAIYPACVTHISTLRQSEVPLTFSSCTRGGNVWHSECSSSWQRSHPHPTYPRQTPAKGQMHAEKWSPLDSCARRMPTGWYTIRAGAEWQRTSNKLARSQISTNAIWRSCRRLWCTVGKRENIMRFSSTTIISEHIINCWYFAFAGS